MPLTRYAGLASLLAAFGIASSAAPGQESDPKPTSRSSAIPNVTRQIYTPLTASPKDLAGLLTQHFHGDPAFRAVPDPGSNTLLLSGFKPTLEDAMAVLREIDRPARTVHVEVLLLEFTGPPGGDAADLKPIDRTALAGSAAQVRAKVAELQQKGQISAVKTVEVSALAGQSARTQATENRPYVTGMTTLPGGAGFGNRGGAGGAGGPAGGGDGPGGRAMARSVSYRSVGTMVQVKPEIGADGLVTLELHLEDSSMRGADSGVTLGSDDKGTAVPAAEFVTSTLETRVKLRPGQIVVAQNTRIGSKSGRAQSIVLVGATTDEAATKDGK